MTYGSPTDTTPQAKVENLANDLSPAILYSLSYYYI